MSSACKLLRWCIFFIIIVGAFFFSSAKSEDDLIIISATFDKDSVQAGEPLTCSWTITGAAKPYQFLKATMIAFLNDGTSFTLASETGDENFTSLTCPAVKGNSIEVNIILKDANGRTENYISYSAIPVIGYDAEPLLIMASFDKEVVQAGEPLTCSWTITGAAKPYQLLKATMIAFLDDGSTYTLASETGDENLTSLTCPAAKGNRIVLYLILIDADGRTETYITYDGIQVYGGKQWIILPQGIKHIEDDAFTNVACIGVFIPSGCESIGDRAFSNCSQLQYAIIPNSVTEISPTAFEGSKKVTITRTN